MGLLTCEATDCPRQAVSVSHFPSPCQHTSYIASNCKENRRRTNTSSCHRNQLSQNKLVTLPSTGKYDRASLCSHGKAMFSRTTTPEVLSSHYRKCKPKLRSAPACISKAGAQINADLCVVCLGSFVFSFSHLTTSHVNILMPDL